MSDESMIEEFKIEAQEMFENSEDGFLKIEKGEEFTSNYNLIFRAFHSLKGAAGMFGLDDLQSHMHKLESLFEAQKTNGKLEKAQIDYFLSGIDVAKALLDGKMVDFKYFSIEEFKNMGANGSSAPVARVATPPKKSSINGKGLFYIVDDEAGILEILSDLVTDLGFNTRTFLSAEELLKNIDDESPDVILSDIKMPDMNGLELLHKIREQQIDTPVIFISGFISKEVMLDALSHGVYGFIEKPFNEVQLKNICENAFMKVATQKLLNKSINYILYQFSDLDNYLKDQGKDTLRQSLKTELTTILAQQKILKELNKK
jgi:FixJ family two-component response regulator/HPt (histidine-containing phosphotransfer) domain-containing protein